MTCSRCEHLERQLAAAREQTTALKRELGLRMRDGAMGALMERFGLQPAQALLVVALFQARTKACSHQFLADFIDAPVTALATQVCRVRRAMGEEDVIETLPAHGYAMTTRGMSLVLGAIEPVATQDHNFA